MESDIRQWAERFGPTVAAVTTSTTEVDIRRRLVLDAILYIVKGGIPWRLLPIGFPPWKTVHSIFRKWTLDHTWAHLNDRLRALARAKQGKRCRPTAAILDSQSVKSHSRPTGKREKVVELRP